MKKILIIVFLICIVNSFKINTKPSSNAYKFNGNFFWKIGKSKNFALGKLNKFIFNDYPICIYRDINNKLIAISDVCVHRGAALSYGKLLNNNCIQCPYHGWEYNSGVINSVPGCPDMKNNFGVPHFELKELNDDVFLCPSYDINSKTGFQPINKIYIPPEANDNSFVRIYGKQHIKRKNTLVTENVLDMMHISYVHSFGNQISPVPFKIHYEDLSEYSGKTTFYYTSGPTSMSNLFANEKYVMVENEFYLPDTTVTRVFAGNFIKTIITNCYPIGKNESILHYDLYRNFLTSSVIDSLFYKQMDITLQEDVNILNGIYDNYIKGFMNTKFDITQLKYREKIKKTFITERKYYDMKNNEKNKN
tara:strand:+ start:4520 stop:5608 length:1089 start_codon:yes stop_codon:yes gene_type:complete